MSTTKWSDIRSELVAQAGGDEALAIARAAQQAHIDGHASPHDVKPSEPLMNEVHGPRSSR